MRVIDYENDAIEIFFIRANQHVSLIIIEHKFPVSLSDWWIYYEFHMISRHHYLTNVTLACIVTHYVAHFIDL